MGIFNKCKCPNCAQSIEYPAEGNGQIVPCPTCQKPVTLFPMVLIATDQVVTTPKQKLLEQTRVRTSLPKLTEETIRTRTKTGDTPLHRAAKLGRIAEIPKHLLSVELFSVKNDRKETPLDVAARSGQLDKIPKEFLTPEILSIAIPYHGTILHHLAYIKRLDVIPECYANSTMWNLRNSRGQTPHDVFHEVNEQERIQRARKSWVPPRLTLPIQTEPAKLLPAFFDESLRVIHIRATTSADIYTVNLLDYTCNNPLCLQIHSGVPPRDFGRLCKHIILALRQKNLVRQLPPIARGIVQNGHPDAAYGIYPGRFENDRNGNPIYITGPNYDGWISVFALRRRNGVNYYRFGYNINSNDCLQTMTSTGAAFYRTRPAI